MIVRDPWFGADEKLRADLGATVAEYVACVDGHDVAVPLRANPYQYDPSLSIAHGMPPATLGGPPVVREVLDGSGSRHGREHVAAVAHADATAYWIGRPFVAVSEGELLGHRPAYRFAELAELAESVGGRDLAHRLKVAGFRHPNPDGLRRHALLASIIDVVRSGRVVPEGPS